MLIYSDRLQISGKSVPLQCVFHSIRFKVNKGWSTAVLLFLCPYVCSALPVRLLPMILQSGHRFFLIAQHFFPNWKKNNALPVTMPKPCTTNETKRQGYDGY